MIFTQLGQASDIDTAVAALAACVADPVACRPTFSKVMVDLTLGTLPADRRVLELISQAFVRGPAGPNPFLETSFAPSVLRIHADADPDLAAELFMQGIDSLLREGVLARANAGPGGFLAHAVDGLEARLVLRTTPPTADLRARMVTALQRVAAETVLADAAQRAQRILTDLGEAITPPQSVPVPIATTTPTSAAVATVDDSAKRKKVIAVAAGLGVALAALAIGMLGAGVTRRMAPAQAHRRRRS